MKILKAIVLSFLFAGMASAYDVGVDPEVDDCVLGRLNQAYFHSAINVIIGACKLDPVSQADLRLCILKNVCEVKTRRGVNLVKEICEEKHK